MILTVSVCYRDASEKVKKVFGIWKKLQADCDQATNRNFVLATGSIDQVAAESLVAVVVEDGQNAAVVQIAILHDFVNWEVLAKFGCGQKLRLCLNNFDGQTADVVPGLAFTSNGSLFNSIISISCPTNVT